MSKIFNIWYVNFLELRKNENLTYLQTISAFINQVDLWFDIYHTRIPNNRYIDLKKVLISTFYRVKDLSLFGENVKNPTVSQQIY